MCAKGDSILRRIHCFPDRTANVAVYGLLGMHPIEQELDARKLSLIATILHEEDSLEHKIALRQLAMRNKDKSSWFMQCNTLLHKYHLPNVFCIRDTYTSKTTLKEAIKKGWQVCDYSMAVWSKR